jgi:endo-1,4-beta-xylanase
MTSRRNLLGMALGMAATAALPAPAGLHPDTTSLNALARKKGMRFGSTVSDGTAGSINDPNYAALLVAECGIVVPEIELKWRALRPDRDHFDFSRFDPILRFAQAHGIAMRGHNLLWQRPKWMPDWVEGYDFGARPATEAERLLRSHITTVCGRYRGRIKSFDVVNEAVLPETGELAQTALSRAIGGTQTLLDLAFRTTRAAAPDAQLVYNDYMSWESANNTHRDGVRKLLEGFRRRGVPVDALGVQSHIVFQDHPQVTAWRQFMDDVQAMGYDVLITEFDVNDQRLSADISARDAAVAAYARDYLDLMFDYPRLRDVLVWGMCDSASWLQHFKPLRADGLAKRPCPYDSNFHPKPLRAAIAGAFMETSARSEPAAAGRLAMSTNARRYAG